jgi:hypothetical protein
MEPEFGERIGVLDTDGEHVEHDARRDVLVGNHGYEWKHDAHGVSITSGERSGSDSDQFRGRDRRDVRGG